MKKPLTVKTLKREASLFASSESEYRGRELYGVTDGKAVGTYLEHKFRAYLRERYIYEEGSSAQGIDFPGIGVDMKVTIFRQPQSSCPFKSARQKIVGLGYSLLVFVYEKTDDAQTETANLNIRHTIFIESHRTADYQMTRVLREILERDGNADDLVACMLDRNLPVDEIGARKIAEDLLKSPPEQGYLTVSNALQWRLQYGRVVECAGKVDGVVRLEGAP